MASPLTSGLLAYFPLSSVTAPNDVTDIINGYFMHSFAYSLAVTTGRTGGNDALVNVGPTGAIGQPAFDFPIADGNGSFTFSLWIKGTSGTLQNCGLFQRGDWSGSLGLEYGAVIDGQFLRYIVGDRTLQYDLNAIAFPGGAQWYNLVCSYDHTTKIARVFMRGADGVVYIEGSGAVGTITATTKTDPIFTCFFQPLTPSSSRYDVNTRPIQDFACWNRALTPEEVYALWRRGTGEDHPWAGYPTAGTFSTANRVLAQQIVPVSSFSLYATAPNALDATSHTTMTVVRAGRLRTATVLNARTLGSAGGEADGGELLGLTAKLWFRIGSGPITAMALDGQPGVFSKAIGYGEFARFAFPAGTQAFAGDNVEFWLYRNMAVGHTTVIWNSGNAAVAPGENATDVGFQAAELSRDLSPLSLEGDVADPLFVGVATTGDSTDPDTGTFVGLAAADLNNDLPQARQIGVYGMPFSGQKQQAASLVSTGTELNPLGGAGRLTYLRGYDEAVIGFGINDMRFASRTYLELKADKVRFLKAALSEADGSRVRRLHTPTLYPVASTDTTTETQEAITAQRGLFNDWYRTVTSAEATALLGRPILIYRYNLGASAWQAQGTRGTGPGTNCDWFIHEYCDLIEAAPANSNLWAGGIYTSPYAGTGYTPDGIHIYVGEANYLPISDSWVQRRVAQFRQALLMDLPTGTNPPPSAAGPTAQMNPMNRLTGPLSGGKGTL